MHGRPGVRLGLAHVSECPPLREPPDDLCNGNVGAFFVMDAARRPGDADGADNLISRQDGNAAADHQHAFEIDEVRIRLAPSFIDCRRHHRCARSRARGGVGLAARRIDQMRTRAITAQQHHQVPGTVGDGDHDAIAARLTDCECGSRTFKRKINADRALGEMPPSIA
jgi:hypothetical protein